MEDRRAARRRDGEEAEYDEQLEAEEQPEARAVGRHRREVAREEQRERRTRRGDVAEDVRPLPLRLRILGGDRERRVGEQREDEEDAGADRQLPRVEELHHPAPLVERR